MNGWREDAMGCLMGHITKAGLGVILMLSIGGEMANSGNRAIAQSASPETTAPAVTPDAPVIQPGAKPAAPPGSKTPAKTPAKAKPKPKQPADEQLPPNPLEISLDDPLVPFDYKERSLTAQEQQEIEAAANRLIVIGNDRLLKGDQPGAFDAWNQELRYRRLLGSMIKEVLALGRVGDVAWRETNTPELRWITRRLDEILAQTRKSLADDRSVAAAPIEAAAIASQKDNPLKQIPQKQMQLWEALGFAYQQVRLPKIASSIYEEVLADARQRNNANRIETALITLGQLHLSWFDYTNAGKAYQELLTRVQTRGDRYNEPIYLNQLAFIHEQAKQPQQAILYQEQLVTFYQTANDPKPIPKLKTKIADNQRLLGKLDLAETNYQQAYNLAIPISQFGDAGDALRKLGDLYRANNRLDSAARIYAFLVGIEQQAYNTYGIMTAYDQLGQIYLTQKEYPQAIAAFQNGLIVAKRLKYREDYFNTQIQQVEKQQQQ
jgi:tetratricopeptide (TPR) repeat protein